MKVKGPNSSVKKKKVLQAIQVIDCKPNPFVSCGYKKVTMNNIYTQHIFLYKK